jgi:hypothetical protein
VLSITKVGPQIDKVFGQRPDPIRISSPPAKLDPEIGAFCPPQLHESTPETREIEPNLHRTANIEFGRDSRAVAEARLAHYAMIAQQTTSCEIRKELPMPLTSSIAEMEMTHD